MNVHMLTLMFRKKDNMGSHGDKYIFREVYTVGDTTMRSEKILKLQRVAGAHKGTWRIYESINERDTDKAHRLLLHRMIDGLVRVDKLDSEWKSLLQTHACRGSRRFLLDLDDCTRLDYETVLDYLRSNSVEILEHYDSVNGYHIITDKFDYRELRELFKFVDVKIDDMKLVMAFEV